MSILTGMAGLKAATDMARSLRDGLKSGQVQGDDIAGRIGEIYDYIVDSKDALVEAKDEIQELKEQNRTLETELKRRKAMKYAMGCYWTKDDGPFCPICWDSDSKTTRLTIASHVLEEVPTEYTKWLNCYFHNGLLIPIPRDNETYEKVVAERVRTLFE
jgi:hypothetical protein